MRIGLSALVVVLVVSTAQAQPAPSLSPESYRQELSRLITEISRLDAAQPASADSVLAAMPDAWHVAATNRAWRVPAASLRGRLAAWRASPKPEILDAVLTELRALEAEAAAYIRPAVDQEKARTALARILAAREFRNVQGPSWFDRLRQQAVALILGFLGRALGSSWVPTISDVVVYLLIIVAVALCAFWVLRTLRRNAAAEAAQLDLAAAPERPWHEWLLQARAAASAGDWRQAVRLAYWCGVAHLEAQGAWRTDLSRTPREYLRLLPAASPHTSPLRALTTLLERVWYAGEPATEDRFDDAMARLRELGCLSA